MTQITITEEGCFDKGAKDDINTNFTELYAQTVLADKATWKVEAISLTATELSGSEVATSFTFPAGAIFLDAWLNVTDNEAASTIDVGTQGTSNDPDGILDGASVASTGYVGQVAGAVGALRGLYVGGDPVSVTASGDLDSCEATLYISYLELPAI